MSHDPIAYTYEADYHCPDCARERFGSAFDDEETEDNEGNGIGAIAPWDASEYCDDGLYCGDCGDEIVAPELRHYGPGKYSLMIDAAVHAATMDGTACTEQCGDCGALGYWYGLIRGAIDPATIPDGDTLTRHEQEYLRQQVGCLIAEYDSGHVCVEYYTDTAELEAAWQDCLAAVARDEAQGEGEA